jgi:hypothetical protein
MRNIEDSLLLSSATLLQCTAILIVVGANTPYLVAMPRLSFTLPYHGLVPAKCLSSFLKYDMSPLQIFHEVSKSSVQNP